MSRSLESCATSGKFWNYHQIKADYKHVWSLKYKQFRKTFLFSPRILPGMLDVMSRYMLRDFVFVNFLIINNIINNKINKYNNKIKIMWFIYLLFFFFFSINY